MSLTSFYTEDDPNTYGVTATSGKTNQDVTDWITPIFSRPKELTNECSADPHLRTLAELPNLTLLT